jgi:hypothetical protein
MSASYSSPAPDRELQDTGHRTALAQPDIARALSVDLLAGFLRSRVVAASRTMDSARGGSPRGICSDERGAGPRRTVLHDARRQEG